MSSFKYREYKSFYAIYQLDKLRVLNIILWYKAIWKFVCDLTIPQ